VVDDLPSPRVVHVFSLRTGAVLPFLLTIPCGRAQPEHAVLKSGAKRAMRKAATFYGANLASHGGYVCHYSLDDNIAGYIAEPLIAAQEVYEDDRSLNVVKRLGDFLLLAQMPEPQPGWAQQYNYDIHPIWA
jgi:hypothetical protein